MSLKCLIVEDSAFMREMYHRVLAESARVEIVGEAADGVEALKLAGELKPDLILLDLVLPLKNGIHVLRELEAASPGSRVLVISSLDDEATVAQAKALGAFVYLKKPFTKAALTAAVEVISQHYSEVQNG